MSGSRLVRETLVDWLNCVKRERGICVIKLTLPDL